MCACFHRRSSLSPSLLPTESASPCSPFGLSASSRRQPQSLSVNDAFVIRVWKGNSNIDDNILLNINEFSEFMKAIGVEIGHRNMRAFEEWRIESIRCQSKTTRASPGF